MDTLYTLLIGGGGSRISDGVDRPTVPAARTFPYLAPPNPPSAAETAPPTTATRGEHP
jgi:hypothetical protein